MKTMETILPVGGVEIVLVDAEGLSLQDKFMDYQPETKNERRTWDLIAEAIKVEVKNFYRPIMDPSFTDDGEGIQFVAGAKPAVGKSYNWWVNAAKNYCPERNSRLGAKLQYGAFLGVLIKSLIEEGMTVEHAWKAVCNDSKELGHFWNSVDAKRSFETTGSRPIGSFYDLANTCKLLEENIQAGGCCCHCGGFSPLAELCQCYNSDLDTNISTGWLVFS